MIDDPAFVWSSGKEGVRRVPRRDSSGPAPTLAPPPPVESSVQDTPVPDRLDRRVTLREAEEATGIPATTLRNWAKKERISSVIDLRDGTGVRLVDLDEVVARGKKLGRLDPEFEPAADFQPPTPNHQPPTASPQPPAPSPQPPAADPPPDESPTRDWKLETGDSPPEAEAGSRKADPEPAIPEGTMLVPLDAWDKMLSQLGNLHEAGQQLAAASERAAKAETEAQFLRERLREVRDDRELLREEQERLRNDRNRLERKLEDTQRRSQPSTPGPAPRPPTRRSMWTTLYRTLRGR